VVRPANALQAERVRVRINVLRDTEVDLQAPLSTSRKTHIRPAGALQSSPADCHIGDTVIRAQKNADGPSDIEDLDELSAGLRPACLPDPTQRVRRGVVSSICRIQLTHIRQRTGEAYGKSRERSKQEVVLEEECHACLHPRHSAHPLSTVQFCPRTVFENAFTPIGFLACREGWLACDLRQEKPYLRCIRGEPHSPIAGRSDRSPGAPSDLNIQAGESCQVIFLQKSQARL
jgi:hypothetical protein